MTEPCGLKYGGNSSVHLCLYVCTYVCTTMVKGTVMLMWVLISTYMSALTGMWTYFGTHWATYVFGMFYSF